jgi:hypothetical protein
MLEGMLLPSGDNIAALLAAWDAGSDSAFVARMNAQARAFGMDHTRYAGASGAGPATVSTARNQPTLARRRCGSAPSATSSPRRRPRSRSPAPRTESIPLGACARAGGPFVSAR